MEGTDPALRSAKETGTELIQYTFALYLRQDGSEVCNEATKAALEGFGELGRGVQRK